MRAGAGRNDAHAPKLRPDALILGWLIRDWLIISRAAGFEHWLQWGFRFTLHYFRQCISTMHFDTLFRPVCRAPPRWRLRHIVLVTTARSFALRSALRPCAVACQQQRRRGARPRRRRPARGFRCWAPA